MLRSGSSIRKVRAFRRETERQFWRAAWFALSALIVSTGLFSSGCAPPPSPSERTRIHEEARQENRVRTDLAFLDGAETEGRQTASRGFSRTASYLAQQLRAEGLQPVLTGEYRTQYAASIRRVVNHRIEFVNTNTDTTRLSRGEDFLLVDFQQSLEMSGAPQRPVVSGLVWHEEPIPNDLLWNVSISVDSRATTAPMHVMGMIPGAEPLQRDSVVVWLAPTDASGLQGVVSWTDGSDLAVPSAALLAAARRAAWMQRTWASIPQTVLVAFLSGTQDGCPGPHMMARHFPWDTDLIAGIVVADMASSDQCDWTEVFSKVGAPLTVLEAYEPFASPAEYGFGNFRPRSETQHPEAIDVALSEAIRLSLEFLGRLP